MNKFALTLIFLMSVIFSASAANFSVPTSVVTENVASISTAKAEGTISKAEKKALKKQQKIEKRMAWFQKILDKKAGENATLAIVACFFLGWLGIHRVVMGGSALLILGYFFTAGGIFGILPLIDFFRLIFNAPHYSGNNKFFAAFM